MVEITINQLLLLSFTVIQSKFTKALFTLMHEPIDLLRLNLVVKCTCLFRYSLFKEDFKGPFTLDDNDIIFFAVKCEWYHWRPCNPFLFFISDDKKYR